MLSSDHPQIDSISNRSHGTAADFHFTEPKGATREARLIPYCRLLPPREIAKLLSANGIVGRGGGDRNCIPPFLSLTDRARYRPLLNPIVRIVRRPVSTFVVLPSKLEIPPNEPRDGCCGEDDGGPLCNSIGPFAVTNTLPVCLQNGLGLANERVEK